jgi:hypothetical protein
MLHGAILLASDNALPFPRAIVFLSIYMEIFKQAISSPYYLPDALYKRYEKLLLAHSLDRPPYAAPIFELADVKLINDFFVNTFFRNIKLIINCFTQKPIMEFRVQFPVHVPLPDLAPLVDMDLLTTARQDEDAGQGRDEASKGKSPHSPRSPRSSGPPPVAERAVTKPVPPPVAPALEPEVTDDRGPDVPVEMLRGSLAQMHEKFVSDFEERERQLVGKIKELEIRLMEKPQLKKPPPKKK